MGRLALRGDDWNSWANSSTQGGMGAGSNEVCHGLARISSGHKRFSDQDSICPLARIFQHVMWSAHARGGDLDNSGGNQVSHPIDVGSVDFQIAQVTRVNTDYRSEERRVGKEERNEWCS